MIRKVAIIGLGSIGGFLAKHLSEFDIVKQLVIVDFDFVERKNISNSIYNFRDIGEFKTSSLENLLQDIVSIEKINTKYIEGQTWLPQCDLIIDCRDFVYDRRGIIDLRVYISGRSLILDCRKKFKSSTHYRGEYNITESDR